MAHSISAYAISTRAHQYFTTIQLKLLSAEHTSKCSDAMGWLESHRVQRNGNANMGQRGPQESCFVNSLNRATAAFLAALGTQAVFPLTIAQRRHLDH